MSNQATTHLHKEKTMKATFTVLTAALAMLAAAPRSSAQGTTKLTVATIAPSKPDTMSSAGITLPPSATVNTVRKIATVKGARKVSTFMAMAPKVEVQNYRPEDKR